MPQHRNRQILFLVPSNISFREYIQPGFNKSYRTIITPEKQDGHVHVSEVKTDMPLGILSIASYCRQNIPDITFRILDFNIVLNRATTVPASFESMFRKEICKLREDFGAPDLIGITALFSPQFTNVVTLAEICKSLYPHVPLVVGGGLATNQHSQLFRTTHAIDACCIGEGEQPMLALLKADDWKTHLQTDPSWVTPETEGKKPLVNAVLECLDDLPQIDFSLCDIDGYSENSVATHIAIQNLDSLQDTRKLHLHVMTSRGCPHRCCFCSSHSVHGRRMRYHSIDRVKRDFLAYIERYAPSCIVLQDDNFSWDKKRTFELLDFFTSLPITVTLTSGLALVDLSKELLQKIYDSGIRQITLPIESGSEKVLREIMHKPLNRSIINRVVRDCRNIGIQTNANILLGLPGETKADIEDTFAFLTTLDINWFYIYAATPLPGSEMYETCKTNRYICEEELETSGFKNPVITTDEFTPEYIADRAYKMNLELNFVHNYAMRNGLYDLAIQQFEKVFKVKADHALCHFMCGICHEKSGRSDSALANFQECAAILQHDPGQVSYFQYLKKTLREKFDSDLAKAILDNLQV